MKTYNTKDLEKAISKKVDIKLKLESMGVDYVGEEDFIKTLEEFEVACEDSGKEAFRLKFMKITSNKSSKSTGGRE